MNLRVGLGADRHPLRKNRKFILGGVQIDFPLGLDGHSDADVLCHAIIDSLLGASSSQDIGTHFPEIDEWKNTSSLKMLMKTAELLREKDWQIINIDATVICGVIKLSNYRDQMIDNLSKTLQIPKECVSVKFKSSNQLGFESNEGVSAIAVCLISRGSAG